MTPHRGVVWLVSGPATLESGRSGQVLLGVGCLEPRYGMETRETIYGDPIQWELGYSCHQAGILRPRRSFVIAPRTTHNSRVQFRMLCGHSHADFIPREPLGKTEVQNPARLFRDDVTRGAMLMEVIASRRRFNQVIPIATPPAGSIASNFRP